MIYMSTTNLLKTKCYMGHDPSKLQIYNLDITENSNSKQNAQRYILI